MERVSTPDGSTVGALARLTLAPFVISFDSAAVNVALPSMRRALDVGDGQIVLTLYAVVFGGLLIASGRAADAIGRERCLTTGMSLFAVGSATAALSQSNAQLVGARIVQAVGAALMAPAALAIIVAAPACANDRGRAIGVYGTAFSAGFATGMLAGGALTDVGSWRSVFGADAAAGAVGAVLVGSTAAPATGRLRDVRDLGQATLATTFMVSLIATLTLGGAAGLDALPTLLSASVCAAAAALFASTEHDADGPMIPRRVRSDPAARRAIVIVALTVGSVSASIFFLASRTQDVLALSPTASGALLSLVGLSAAAGGWIAPTAMRAIGTRPTLVVGLVAQGTANLGLATLPSSGPAIAVAAGAIVCGAGHMAANVAASTVFTAALPVREQGMAAGLLSTAQQLGTGIWLALAVATATTGRVGLLLAALAAFLALSVASRAPHDGSGTFSSS